eukprot:4044084-Prymnesium_polylepis.1
MSYIAETGIVPSNPPLPKEHIYFTNFFLTNIKWWNTTNVSRFLADVDATGGIYRHRWGDAPIQTAALGLHATPREIRQLDVDYVHLSTRNKIVSGEEVTFNGQGIPNPHFRQMVEESGGNETNGSSSANVTSAVTHGHRTGCADAEDAFASIHICTGGSGCDMGMSSGAATFGGWSIVCGSSVSQIIAFTNHAGCSVTFTPPAYAAQTTLMYELCPTTCANAGFLVPGCSLSPMPPSAPYPPKPPPMPPLIPGPDEFSTVATAAQLRDSIAATPPNGSLNLYLPQGTIMFLEGIPIAVGNIKLQLISDGDGAVLDAARRSRIFEIRTYGGCAQ